MVQGVIIFNEGTPSGLFNGPSQPNICLENVTKLCGATVFENSFYNISYLANQSWVLGWDYTNKTYVLSLIPVLGPAQPNIDAANITTGIISHDRINWSDINGTITAIVPAQPNIVSKNVTDFNESVLALVSAITFNASSVNTVVGTVNYGTVASIQVLDDNLNYSVQEVSGIPGMDIRVNFTGVSTFDNILMNEFFSDNIHTIDVQVWDYATNSWQSGYFTFGAQSGYVTTKIAVLDSQEHIQNGIVSLRFYHSASGVVSHFLNIDYVALQKGFTGLTLNKHDALSGLQNFNTNHPLYASMLVNLNNSLIAGNNTLNLINGSVYKWDGYGSSIATLTENSSLSMKKIADSNLAMGTYNISVSNGYRVWNQSGTINCEFYNSSGAYFQLLGTCIP